MLQCVRPYKISVDTVIQLPNGKVKLVQLLCFHIYIYYIELLSLALEGSCISCTTSRRIDIASGLNRSQSEARFNSARGYC